MRIALLMLLTLAAPAAELIVPRGARAVDVMVYKVSLKIVATTVITGSASNPDVILTKKLSNDDFVNLALGRPLGTKVDAKTEILAGVGDFEPHMTSSPVERFIVFDPSQNGAAQVKATVATLSTLDYQGTAFPKSLVVGIGTGVIQDTVLGDPAKNGFVSTALCGRGEGSGGHLSVDQIGNLVFPAIKGNGTASGRLKFNFTDKNGVTTNFDGYIAAAQGKVSGKPIGMFSE